jgi:spore coat protein CotH
MFTEEHMSLKSKRYYPLILLLVFVLAFFTLAMGNLRIIAYTAQASSQNAIQSKVNYTNNVALFDDTVIHSIQILISDEDYNQMITTYKETGLKDYFHADVIIDGVRVNDVGIRLKGNASLMTALGGRGSNAMANMMNEFRGGQDMQLPEGFDPNNLPEGFNPQNMRPGADDGNIPQGFDRQNPPEGFDANNLPQGFDQQNLPGGFNPQNMAMPFGNQDGEAKIPFLIKFDEFVNGQTYQGYTHLAIRTYGTSSDASMLQEPVTNYVFRLAGLPATQTAYAGFRFNDEAEQLFTISEIIDETYLAEHFTNSNGVLYKAELGSTLSYQGEDPSSYATSFTQQTRVNDADMAPLIAFVRFLSESDDATFESELPNYLDVEAFATYLAVNNLLVNADSVAGMNNNYYLYYADTSGRFTLLMWDANESLGKLTGGNSTTYDLYFTSQQGMAFPGGGNRGGPGGGKNELLTRFMANATFKALYEEKLKAIYQQAFLSGAITEKIEAYASLVQQANQQRNLVTLENYDAAVTSVLNFISQRSEYLSTTTLLGGPASQSK